MDKIKKFYGLLASDFMKLAGMKSVYIGLGIMVFLTLIFGLAQNAFSALLQEMPDSGAPVDPGAADALTGVFVNTMLNGAPSATGVFFLLPIIAALFVGSEFSSGMARLYIGRGVHKTELYTSKFIVLSVLSVIYVCLAFAMCSIAAAASDIGEDTMRNIAAYTPSAFGSYVFLAVAMSAVYTAVCFALRSKAASMATLIAMLIVLGDILVIVVQIALGTSVTGEENAAGFVYMLFDPYYCADAFAAARDFTAREAGIAYGGCAMWLVLFFTGGLVLNAKRDVK